MLALKREQRGEDFRPTLICRSFFLSTLFRKMKLPSRLHPGFLKANVF